MRSSAELGSEEISRDFVGNIRMESEMKVLSNAVMGVVSTLGIYIIFFFGKNLLLFVVVFDNKQ